MLRDTLLLFFGAVSQFSQRDGGDRHTTVMPVENLQYRKRSPFDENNGDVGVEEICQRRRAL